MTVATFDCYGTLIDWEGGAASFLYDHARRQGDERPGSAHELRRRWEELQFELVQGPYLPYRDVLAASLRTWSDERGYAWDDEAGRALVRSMESWQPFRDTVPALRAARAAGLRLWIVSNTDRSIMDHTLGHMDVDFDGVTVAEDVGAYKPGRAPFERALEQIGEPPEQVLHVAFGFKYDIPPAQAFGMQAAWVNRAGEPRPGSAVPDHEWRDLWPLADVARP